MPTARPAPQMNASTSSRAFQRVADGVAQAMMNGDITPQDAQAATRVFKALQEQMRRADHQNAVAALPDK